MKNRITQKVKAELKTLVDQKGYWSEEVRNYLSEFEYYAAQKLCSLALNYEKYGYGL